MRNNHNYTGKVMLVLAHVLFLHIHDTYVVVSNNVIPLSQVGSVEKCSDILRNIYTQMLLPRNSYLTAYMFDLHILNIRLFRGWTC